MVTGFDSERSVIFKSDPLKGCKKTSGTIVGFEGDKGVVSVGGGRVARFLLI